MTEVNQQQIDQIIAKKEEIKASLLSKPGVNGIDVGFKRVGGKLTDIVAIRVHVVKKKNVPIHERIPKEINGIKTDVLQREFKPLAIDKNKYRPLIGGSGMSTSNTNHDLAGGTLGAIVYDETNSQFAALTNYHVAAIVKDAWAVGDRMAQPEAFGADDRQVDEFGSLVRVVLSEHVDGAILSIDEGIAYRTSVIEIGQIKGSRDATLNMKVRKRGRTTQLSYGIVTGLSGSFTVNYGYDVGPKNFEDQILISPDLEHSTDFSSSGDSGSVVVDEDNYIVGLLFASTHGADGESSANKISHVMSELNISIPEVEDPDLGDGAATSYTSARSQQIEDNVIVSGSIDLGILTLTKGGGDTVEVGMVGGADGEQGPPGADGSDWLTGTGAPDPEDGIEGQYYLDTITGNFYEKTDPDWILKGGLKGPTGNAGPNGSGGILTNRITTDATVMPSITDNFSIIFCNRATAISLSVQDFDTMGVPIGCAIAYKQVGVGTIYISYGAGVTLDVSNGAVSAHTRARNSVIFLYHESLNHWVITGDFIEEFE